jgi:hypothetical protein
MKSKTLGCFAVAIGLLTVSSPIFAHHGTSEYDIKKTITLTGTITAFDWVNPHCLVHMDVTGDNGEVRHWTLEMSPTYSMSRRGWAKDTLKLGDQVSAETHPARNGAPIGISAARGFMLNFAVNGKEIRPR